MAASVKQVVATFGAGLVDYLYSQGLCWVGGHTELSYAIFNVLFWIPVFGCTHIYSHTVASYAAQGIVVTFCTGIWVIDFCE